MAEQAKSEFAQQILEAAGRCKPKIVKIPCPELDGVECLWGRSFDGDDRSAYTAAMTNRGNGTTRADANEQFAIRVLCNEDGELLFTEQDVGSVRKWPASLTQRVWRKMAPYCGLALSDLEDEVKN